MGSARFMKMCVDANEPVAVGSFWATALALDWRPDGTGEGGVYFADGRCLLWVNQVPEQKTVKHRVHLDMYAHSLDDVTALGSRVVLPEGDDRFWTVMADPEDGEYCAFLRTEMPERRLHGVVVDCAEPARQARWWAGVFGIDVTDDPSGFSTLENVPGMPIATMDFCPVPEPKVTKNRLHWDVAVADVRPLVDAGATVLVPPHDDVEWTVLADPEGNEFCAFPRP